MIPRISNLGFSEKHEQAKHDYALVLLLHGVISVAHILHLHHFLQMTLREVPTVNVTNIDARPAGHTGNCIVYLFRTLIIEIYK